MRHAINRAAVGGAVVGAAHFVAICGLASFVLREQDSGMSQEYWEYAGMFDLPVSLVLLLFSPMLNMLAGVASWPDVAFLPGITGSWNKFLIPFFIYGIFGTLVWSLIGWSVMRITRSRHLP